MGTSHWYRRNGNRAERYTQTNKDGSESKIIRKGIALRDGAVEGVTSIISRCSDTSFLQGWFGKLGIEAGIKASEATTIDLDGELCFDSKVADLAKVYLKEASEAAANRGSDIHDAIDTYLSTGVVSEDPVIANAQTGIRKLLDSHGVTEFECEHCLYFKGGISFGDLVLPMAYGGTTDLISREWIWDWKTCELGTDGKYHTGKSGHCAQMAAYRHAAWDMGLCSHYAKCSNAYIDRVTGDIVAVVHWTPMQLDAGLEWLAWGMNAWTRLEKLEGMLK